MSDMILVPDDINPVELYSSDESVTEMIASIKDKAMSVVPDMDTVKGRREIASLASKVAKSKTYLDGLGKDLVSDQKKKIKEVDQRRKKLRDTLDDIKDEVRKPLTDFQEAEKKRVEIHETNIIRLRSIEHNIALAEYESEATDLMSEAEAIGELNFEEYDKAACDLIEKIDVLYGKVIRRIKEEARIAEESKRLEDEQAKLRAERDAIDREKREKALAEQAARMAREDAERESQEREARVQAEANAAYERARAADAERVAAEERALAAERDAEDREARARFEAKEQARRDEEAAKEYAESEARARAADTDHKRAVNTEILNAMIEAGISVGSAKKVITAIVRGEIPHTSITY